VGRVSMGRLVVKMTDLEKALDDKIVPWTEVELKTRDYWVFKDAYPVSEGHQLFVPTSNNMPCLVACYEAAYKFGFLLLSSDRCNGYNVGQNIGAAAGQTVNYPHVHMIPRIDNDMEYPAGGVRNVIPNMGNYKNPNYILTYDDVTQLRETFGVLGQMWSNPEFMTQSVTPLIKLERILHKLGSQKHANLRS